MGKSSTVEDAIPVAIYSPLAIANELIKEKFIA